MFRLRYGLCAEAFHCAAVVDGAVRFGCLKQTHRISDEGVFVRRREVIF